MGTSDKKLENITGPVLLVEDDAAIRSTVVADLKKLGIQKVKDAGDGETAWQKIQSQDFALVVADWKMPEISGLALINRIRGDGRTWHLPVVILSGYLARDDFRLLDEFPLIGKLEKPYDLGALARQITDVVEESTWIAREHATLKSLTQGIEDNHEKVFGQIKDILANSPKPVPFAVEAGKVLTEAGQLDDAEVLLKTVLKSRGAGSIAALNQLGKIFLIRGQHKHAAVVLEKAHSLCPQNIDRICNLGKANLNIGETEKAKEYFNAALRIDPASERAKDGIQIADTLEEYIVSHGIDRVTMSFASVMNSIGISKVRGGEHEDGMALYRMALQNVDSPDTQAKLAFNLGLGLVRANKLEESQEWLERAIEMAGGEYEKAERHLTVVQTRLEKEVESDDASPKKIIKITDPEDGASNEVEASDTVSEEGMSEDGDFDLPDDLLAG